MSQWSFFLPAKLKYFYDKHFFFCFPLPQHFLFNMHKYYNDVLCGCSVLLLFLQSHLCFECCMQSNAWISSTTFRKTKYWLKIQNALQKIDTVIKMHLFITALLPLPNYIGLESSLSHKGKILPSLLSICINMLFYSAPAASK